MCKAHFEMDENSYFSIRGPNRDIPFWADDFNSNSNGDATITWDVLAVASAGLPTDVSGSAGISLSGGGGGSANDNLSLVAKAKTGDYPGANGSKSSVELGWGGGSNGTSSYSLDLAGDFATNADGEVETTLTQDEFDINANSSSNGNDWFRAKRDGKSNVVTDAVAGD